MNRLTLSIARPVFVRLADGNWHNFLTHEALAGDVSAREWFLQVIGLGVLIGQSWAERDDTWARLTPRGKEAMALYLRQGAIARA
jgi:hypothetical protein